MEHGTKNISDIFVADNEQPVVTKVSQRARSNKQVFIDQVQVFVDLCDFATA